MYESVTARHFLVVEASVHRLLVFTLSKYSYVQAWSNDIIISILGRIILNVLIDLDEEGFSFWVFLKDFTTMGVKVRM